MNVQRDTNCIKFDANRSLGVTAQQNKLFLAISSEIKMSSWFN